MLGRLSPAAILIFGPIPRAAKDQPKLVLALLVERGVESLKKSVVVQDLGSTHARHGDLLSSIVLQYQSHAVQVSGLRSRVDLKRVPGLEAKALRELDLDAGLVNLPVPGVETGVV